MVSGRRLYRCDTCCAEYSAEEAAETCETVHLIESLGLAFKKDMKRILARATEQPRKKG